MLTQLVLKFVALQNVQNRASDPNLGSFEQGVIKTQPPRKQVFLGSAYTTANAGITYVAQGSESRFNICKGIPLPLPQQSLTLVVYALDLGWESHLGPFET